ncbi:MAG: tRNA guanosine(34) transglycosylase Tgt [Actinomycetes bacterium]
MNSTNPPVTWEQIAADGAARTGWLNTPHGRFRTPMFMPVGTRATVKTVDCEDLEAIGAGVILANTYHLMLRPGSELIRDMGGIHGFMGWERGVLTDSGGFQIFSLDPRIDEEGARFRSVYDGRFVTMTPEDSIRIQQEIGADIAMALDVCVGLPSPREVVEREMRRTLRWAERCLAAHDRSDQALFGIVQGGADPELRAESAEETAAMGFPGFGIGGLAVGESAEERNAALEVVSRHLPAGKPRYVMGLGDPEGLLDAIARGVDMFDCVIPTRLARHGRVLTADGDYNLKRAEFAADGCPLEEGCGCPTCSRYSRSYLRHLLGVKEMTGYRLVTIHNIWYLVRLMESARAAIEQGRFEAFAAEARARRAVSQQSSPSA